MVLTGDSKATRKVGVVAGKIRYILVHTSTGWYGFGIWHGMQGGKSDIFQRIWVQDIDGIFHEMTKQCDIPRNGILNIWNIPSHCGG